jgi:hypothetical protein
MELRFTKKNSLGKYLVPKTSLLSHRIFCIILRPLQAILDIRDEMTLSLLPAKRTLPPPYIFYCHNLSPLMRTIQTHTLCAVKAILVKQFGKGFFYSE